MTDTETEVCHEWFFGPAEVVQNRRTGQYHHVGARFIQVDTGERFYRIWDATHTSRWTVWEGDAKADFAPVRVQMTLKPAAVFGKRVGGILAGPNEDTSEWEAESP